jgi:hypothetical protein
METFVVISRDPDGAPEMGREPIVTPNGGVSVGARVDSYLLNQTAGGTTLKQFGNLQRLEAICLATGLSPGFWTIRDATGAAANILQVLQQPKVSTPGDRYVWEFPTPLQTILSVNSNADPSRGFHVRPSASGMGTWFFFANGYLTLVEQGASDY